MEKFTREELFEMAEEEYAAAGMLPARGSAEWNIWAEGVGEWAYQSEGEAYQSGDEVREELRALIAEEKELRENI